MSRTIEEKRDFLRDLGDRIRRRRMKLGFSQRAFAEHVGVSKSLLSFIERDERRLTIDRVRDFAEALGVKPGWFFGAKR